MKYVPPSVPDTVMGKEVVSIRAIWDRISFVWPVPAKHRPLFCSTPEMENSKVKNQKFEIDIRSAQYFLMAIQKIWSLG